MRRLLMRNKLFGRRTGLRVSELALGTGNFGIGWGYGADREEAKRIFEPLFRASSSVAATLGCIIWHLST
jgi:aryl-alcohol dehydrogenase-like predicted oxidoreductase